MTLRIRNLFNSETVTENGGGQCVYVTISKIIFCDSTRRPECNMAIWKIEELQSAYF